MSNSCEMVTSPVMMSLPPVAVTTTFAVSKAGTLAKSNQFTNIQPRVGS